MASLPSLFISHGSPMHALDAGAPGRAWAALADALPRPSALLMVSAHWETSLPLLGGSRQPETMHDFGGFPAELYQLRYPAPGAPEVAERAAALLHEAGLGARIDGLRGLDHGAWSPLLHMYPQADVPVVQLSDIGIDGSNIARQGGLMREASDMQRVASEAAKAAKTDAKPEGDKK